MSQRMQLEASPVEEPEEDGFIPRRETGLRILLTLLFVLVASVLEAALALVVCFQLVVSLVTERPPTRRLRELANRIVSYYYRIGRYLTYNESRVPFPFAEFPEPLEGDAWDADEVESRALGLSWSDPDPDDDEDREPTGP